VSAELRLYAPPDPFGSDGYPVAWHQTIKHLVREQAGHRCVRCGHPYRVGRTGPQWSPCDRHCTHGGPARYLMDDGEWSPESMPDEVAILVGLRPVEAAWRVLTVHHLDGDKANCRWWNLAALCQRCHLEIQSRVVMDRRWLYEHSDWFKPYVAGYYAHVYLGQEIGRDEAENRLNELLALEHRQLDLIGGTP
jgi:hypothetical protein